MSGRLKTLLLGFESIRGRKPRDVDAFRSWKRPKMGVPWASRRKLAVTLKCGLRRPILDLI